MYFDTEETLMGAGKGAATGASIGSVVPGIGTGIGAGIGAGVGAISGFFSGNSKHKAKKQREAAVRQQREMARQQYAQRMADVDRAMQYFQPVNNKLRELYGSDAAVDYQPGPRLL